MGKFKDLTGITFGHLYVLEYGGKHPKSGRTMWKVRCDCGVEKLTEAHGLTSGRTISCGHIGKARIGKETKRYMNDENKVFKKEYNAWNGMRSRCRDTTSQDSHDYRERGIRVCDEWEHDFLAFLEHIGPAPKDGQRWSVGRIDNNKGYEPNNVRWEQDSTQARNHSKQRNNSSGVTGVFFGQSGHGYGSPYWQAYWKELDGKVKSKCFSVKEYGYDKAFELACEYRKSQIERLNEEGAGYALTHGQDK